MNKNILSVLFCLCVINLFAQGNKKAQTKSGAPVSSTKVDLTAKNDKVNTKKPLKPMSTTNMSDQIKFINVNGIRVIIKPTTNDVVSTNILITGGVNNFTMDKQGLEGVCLDVLLDGGSKKYPKEIFHKTIESKGIGLGSNSGFDYSVIQLKTTSKTFNLGWDILSDVINYPEWNEQSMEQIKGQVTSGLMQQAQDPDESLTELVRKGIFTGTSYEKNPDGTAETVNALTLDDCKKYLPNITQKSKMIIVVVGKVTAEDIKSKVEAAFGALPMGQKDVFDSKPVAITSNQVTIEEREIATNYMRGVLPAAKVGSKESVALRIAYAILADRLFVEVRTKRNLSYAPSASVASNNFPYGSIYVTTTQPNDAAKVMLDEIKKIKSDGFTAKELVNQKEGFLTSYFMNQETNDGQAVTLGVAESRLGYMFAINFREEVKSLTLEEVNAAFRKYATNIHWFYLGDKSKVDESIFKGL